MTIGPVVVCGAMFGLGLAGLARTIIWHREQPPDGRVERSAPALRKNSRRRGFGGLREIVISTAVGIACFAVTGWPAALVIGFAAGYGVPRLLGQTSSMRTITKSDAIATWTEMLQGTLAASAGLSQAIMTTASLAPTPIRPETESLAARLDVGMDPREALTLFAGELDNPSADRVVCALLLATTVRAQRLGELLSSLAEATRQEVALRLRVDTSRSSVRSGVRTVLVFSVAFAGALALLARSYLAPFGTVSGQAVLIVVAGLYGAGLTLLVTMSRAPATIRLLGNEGQP